MQVKYIGFKKNFKFTVGKSTLDFTSGACDAPAETVKFLVASFPRSFEAKPNDIKPTDVKPDETAGKITK